MRTNINIVKKYVLFDLDGTITDSAEGIINSFQFALAKFNIHVEDKDELKRVIGPPLKDSFMNLYSLSEQNANIAIEAYREYYKEKGIYENKLYPNIKSFLHILKLINKKIILATSKPTEYAIEILKYFSIFDYFTDVIGSTFNEDRQEKIDVMRYALEKNNISNLAYAIMIGDRKFDIEASNALNIDSIGVLYGYGSKEELIQSGATYLAPNILNLFKYFINN